MRLSEARLHALSSMDMYSELWTTIVTSECEPTAKLCSSLASKS